MEAVIYNFFQFLKQGKIMGRKCLCGEIAFPPRGLCLACGGDLAHWVEMAGKGKLLFASAGANRFYSEEPFILATVQLDEGPIIAAPLLNEDSFDHSQPEQIWDYNAEQNIFVNMFVSKNPAGGDMVAFARIV